VPIIAFEAGKLIGIGRRSARRQFLRKSFMSHVIENRHLLTSQEIKWTRCPGAPDNIGSLSSRRRRETIMICYRLLRRNRKLANIGR
jgi:hypothetical protein